MNIGKTIRCYTIEPLFSPVPRPLPHDLPRRTVEPEPVTALPELHAASLFAAPEFMRRRGA